MIHRIYWYNRNAIGTYINGEIRDDPEGSRLTCNSEWTFEDSPDFFLEELL